ncbi:hypothetical protein [Pseudonocardia sp. GCM10023141]|uniref:hypothetical protein n=1 Tax=Pseudonocardia sp. GCM10023141 TaxID=3252653 RepID=UPI003622B0B9
MTVLDESPRTTYIPRQHRRHEIVTTDGMAGILCIGSALATCGYPVRDFAADVREGVPYSSITCTVSLTGAELERFTAQLLALPAVVAVDPC